MEPKLTGGGGHDRGNDADIPANMDDLQASDAFLTALSHGVDPSNGSDELAALLLGLRDEVEAPMPAAPNVSGYVPVRDGAATNGTATEEAPAVSSLDQRRILRGRHSAEGGKGSRHFRTNPWAAGLVGAAAATVLVAGTGAALYNATPGSALWGPSEAVFGERTNTVEFASALDEIESKTESGDIAGARVLIEQLRESMKHDRSSERAKRPDRGGAAPATSTLASIVTVSPSSPKPADQPAAPESPATVTVTPEPVTETVTVTETAQAQNGRGGEPSQSVNAPMEAPTIPTTTRVLGSPQPTQQPAAQSSE